MPERKDVTLHSFSFCLINYYPPDESLSPQENHFIRKDVTQVDQNTQAPATEESPARPPVEHSDCTPPVQMTPHRSFSDFLIRVDNLTSQRADWSDPTNKNRPFKHSFIEFIHRLVLRMPVAPELVPLTDGTVRFRYRKNHAPKDKWQVLEIIVTPKRVFSLTARSRLPNQAPYTRTNTARPDILSDLVRSFYELDSVNVQDHPLKFRSINVNDIPYISAMCQTSFGPHTIYKPKNIGVLLDHTVVAEDPIYGIMSVAAIHRSERDDFDYEVSFLITVENCRGLSLASQCLRKAVTNVLAQEPEAEILATSILPDGQVKDVAQSALRRAGFRRIRIVRGERRYRCFDCDRCNKTNGWCDFEDPNSVCSTVYYRLSNHGGKLGYGGRKVTGQ